MERFSLCLQFLRELVGSLVHINALVTYANSYIEHDPVSIIQRGVIARVQEVALIGRFQ